MAATVTGAAVTHLVELGREGAFAAIPWNLLAWAVPGAIVGAVIGSHLQGRIAERASRLFFAGLFGLIGITFVTVFGLGLGPVPWDERRSDRPRGEVKGAVPGHGPQRFGSVG